MANAQPEKGFINRKSQNTIAVHVGLPPEVPGDVRGELEVTFPSLLWDCSTPPPAPRLNVLLKWWGEKSQGSIFRVPVLFDKKSVPSITPSSAIYTVHSSWKKLKTYFEDMSHLTLQIGLGRKSEDMFIMGECIIPQLSTLTPHKPFTRTCSVVTVDGIHLGRLSVHMALTITNRKHQCSLHPENVSKESDVLLRDTDSKSLKKDSNIRNHTHHNDPLNHIHHDEDPIPGSLSSRPKISADVHVCPVPIKTNNKWKTVQPLTIPTTSVIDPVITTEGKPSTDHLKSLQLGEKGRELIQCLLEQAKQLHDDMIKEIGGVSTDHNKPTTTCDDDNCSQSLELTLPHSPDSTCSIDILHEVGLVQLPSEDLDITPVIAIQPSCDHTQQPGDQQLHNHIQSSSDHKPSYDLPQQSHDLKEHTNDYSLSKCIPPSTVDSDTNTPIITGQTGHFGLVTSPHMFHFLLDIAEASSLQCPSDYRVLPNVYMICRMFCLDTPICTGIYWKCRQPHFKIKQIIPVILQESDDLNGQYVIIELWHCINEIISREHDELLGLVKVSLGPLCIALFSVMEGQSDLESVFPVTVVDSYCPIIDPISGGVSGHLKIKVVVGTPNHIPSTLGVSSFRPPSSPTVKTYHTLKSHAKSSEDIEQEKDMEKEGEDKDRKEKRHVRKKTKLKDDLKDSKSTTSKTKNSRDDTIVEEQTQDNILSATNITRETQTSAMTLPIDSPLSNIVPKQIQFELLISQAHHLPLVSSQQRLDHHSLPRAYVTCHPHPSVPKLTTPISAETTDPHWEYPCVTHVPSSFLETGLCELEFQVWSLPSLPSGTTEALISEADPHTHVFIGRAYVDLLPLQCGLRTICGWYNITDLTGDIKGQLKVAITPKDRMPPKGDNLSLLISHSNNSIHMPLSHWSSTVSSIHCEPQQLSVADQEEKMALSFLRRQLKSHIQELESIQESLTHKLQGPPHSQFNSSNEYTVASNDCPAHCGTLPNVADCSNNIPPINIIPTSTIIHDDVAKQTDPVISHNKSQMSSPIIHVDVITSEDLPVASPVTFAETVSMSVRTISSDDLHEPTIKEDSPTKTLSVHSDHEPLVDEESTIMPVETIPEQPNHNLHVPPTVKDILTDNTSLTSTNEIPCLQTSPNEDSPVHSTGIITNHLTQDLPLFKEDLFHYDFPITSDDKCPLSPTQDLLVPVSEDIPISTEDLPITQLTTSPLSTSPVSICHTPTSPLHITTTTYCMNVGTPLLSPSPSNGDNESDREENEEEKDKEDNEKEEEGEENEANEGNSQIEANNKTDVEEKLNKMEVDKVESKEHENVSTPPQVNFSCDNDTALTVNLLSGDYSSSRTHQNDEQFIHRHLLSDKDKNTHISEQTITIERDIHSPVLISSSDNESDIDELVPERVTSDTDDFEPDNKDISSEDLEEEQEVQKILERLLKHPVNISDTESCPELSSSTSDSETSAREEDHKSIILSTDESDDECIERAHTKTRRIIREQLPSYFLPEEELADKLRALRLLALSRRSPRLPSELTPPTTNDIRTKGSPDKERESDKRTYPYINTSEKDRLHRIFYCKDNR